MSQKWKWGGTYTVVGRSDTVVEMVFFVFQIFGKSNAKVFVFLRHLYGLSTECALRDGGLFFREGVFWTVFSALNVTDISSRHEAFRKRWG